MCIYLFKNNLIKRGKMASVNKTHYHQLIKLIIYDYKTQTSKQN